jgi:hypothetical protein
MNAFQKATLIVSFTFLPLVLLFMNAMDYPGLVAAGIAGIAGTAALLHTLRSPSAGVPQPVDIARFESSPRQQAISRPESRGLR